MQNSKLYASRDYESTIYSICMHQNLLFFMEKLPKMVVSWSKIEHFGLRQAVAEPPPPHFEGPGCKKGCCVDTPIAQTQFTAFLCPKICHFSIKSAKNGHFFIKNCLSFLARNKQLNHPLSRLEGARCKKAKDAKELHKI